MDFYDSDVDDLTADEKDQLTPILNTLYTFTDRYEVGASIGGGGEKRVFEAVDLHLGRKVAMAYAKNEDSELDKEEFLREACLIANLEHPNILSVHDIGVDELNSAYFTMDLLPAGSLREQVDELDKKARLEKLPDLLEVFLKICDAIDYAHSRGVVHLDLKPDNIRLGHFGELFICDWGLAKIVDAETFSADRRELDGQFERATNLRGNMRGTIGYMAPEQTTLDGDVSELSDIYALGGLLYFILTGNSPISEGELTDSVSKIRGGKVRPFTERAISSGLAAVALKALSTEKEDRYPSVLALRRDVLSYIRGFATQAQQASLPKKAWLWALRHSKVVSLLAGVSALIAFLGMISSAVINNERNEAVKAKELADRNLHLYQKEHDIVQQMGEDVNRMMSLITTSVDARTPRTTIQLIRAKLEQDLSPRLRSNLMMQLGVQYFVLQEFNAAYDCFKESDEHYAHHLMHTTKYYAKLKPHEKRLLSDRDLAAIFVSPNLKVYQQFSYALYYHHMRRRYADGINRPGAYMPLAEAILWSMNCPYGDDFEPFRIERGKNGFRLDLSDGLYSTYRLLVPGLYQVNVLEGIKFEYLDISNTPLTNMFELKPLNVETLKMVNMPRFPFHRFSINLAKEMGVKKLIVSESEISGKMLKQMKKNFEVEVLP
ncbi:serine/threonine protein kinase [Persicirhabdus sediminis]|uniref:Serine/threonine protein kinase n=1 Tax=Persicirhabdus sediminis TaxID=454144 RepID=A0A8J7MFZ6_9BACT|nr:serine/threonine-protein kinase [Persicirhabdus sediminis]MBK1792140.1 serine/threonine protein kinase [Persicirhabdus sediminis]